MTRHSNNTLLFFSIITTIIFLFIFQNYTINSKFSPTASSTPWNEAISIQLSNSSPIHHSIHVLPTERWNFEFPIIGYDNTGKEYRDEMSGQLPVIGDVDNNGDFEVIFSTNIRTYSLDADSGSTIWESLLGSDTSPCIANLDLDPTLEVVITGDRKVHALDAENGAELWVSPTDGIIMSSPTLIDVNGDPFLDVIIGDDSGKLYAINGENGSHLWTYQTNDSIRSSPAVGDLNSNGFLEVVFTSFDGNIYALHVENGSKIWNKYVFNDLAGYTALSISSSPVLADVDNDSKLEVIVGSRDNKVYTLSGDDGSILWSYKTNGPIQSSPTLGDIDNDRQLEVVIGSDDTKVYALNAEDGSQLWNYTTDGTVVASATLGDIDGDRKLEVVIGSFDGVLYTLDAENGDDLWKYPIGTTIEIWGAGGVKVAKGRLPSAAALFDVNNDNSLEILIGVDGPPFKFFALNLENSGQRVYWEGLKGSSTTNRTGNLLDIDFDQDFLSDQSEKLFATNSTDPDSDHDSMLDGWEVTYWLDPNTIDPTLDPDQDTLTNIQEYTYFTNPNNPDSDEDNMDDDWEVLYGLNPIYADGNIDSDGDALTNVDEYIHGTIPTDPDSDDDGLTDGEEVTLGFDPTEPDSDDDGMPDGWEYSYGLDPLTPSRNNDSDSDKLTDYFEYKTSGTAPNNSDTDFDGLSDYDEVYTYSKLNATNPDTDGDTMLDGWEIKYDLNPLSPLDSSIDADGDGLTNLQEHDWFVENGSYLDPTNNDTDADGLFDGKELDDLCTNPTINDTDADGLLDGREIALRLDPCNNDTDNDGEIDGKDPFPNNYWLNTGTLTLSFLGGSTFLVLLALGGVSYRFVYQPRRTMIKEWWNRRVLRLYHREEDILEYAGKARKEAKKFDEEKNNL